MSVLSFPYTHTKAHRENRLADLCFEFHDNVGEIVQLGLQEGRTNAHLWRHLVLPMLRVPAQTCREHFYDVVNAQDARRNLYIARADLDAAFLLGAYYYQSDFVQFLPKALKAREYLADLQTRGHRSLGKIIAAGLK